MLIAYHGKFDPKLIPRLKNSFPDATIKSHAEIIDQSERNRINVLIARGGLRMDKSFLDAAPALRLIVKAGSGVDDIDHEAAKRKGIAIHATGGSETSVAELAVTLALTCLRHLTVHNDAMKDGSRRSRNIYTGRSLEGRTVTLIGFGRIGRSAARLFAAFGARLLVHDRSPDQPEKRIAAKEINAEFLPLREAVAGSEIISLHAPWSMGEPPILNSEIMNLVRPSTVLINTARANLIDREALIEALDDGRISFAGLDVLYDEIEGGDTDIIQRENVIALPHVGAQTAEAQDEIARRIAAIVTSFLEAESSSPTRQR